MRICRLLKLKSPGIPGLWERYIPGQRFVSFSWGDRPDVSCLTHQGHSGLTHRLTQKRTLHTPKSLFYRFLVNFEIQLSFLGCPKRNCVQKLGNGYWYLLWVLAGGRDFKYLCLAASFVLGWMEEIISAVYLGTPFVLGWLEKIISASR